MLRLTTQLSRTSVRRYATEVAKPSSFGQPVFQSHPHLSMLFFSFYLSHFTYFQAVKSNELTPGIPSEDYERRRRSLMDSLPEDSVVISVAAPVKYMSNSM
jgi:intermediate cleaving peptidase 55